MERLVNNDAVSLFRQIVRAGQARRAAADNGDFFAGPGSKGRRIPRAALHLPVRGKPLEAADAHGFELFLQGTDLFTLALLRADPAADRGQEILLSDRIDGLFDVSFPDRLDKSRYRNVHRSEEHTSELH